LTKPSQVFFTKVPGGGLEEFEDSGDDENAISVDDLLADTANDPDSELDNDKSEGELNGSPLSAGTALAPANSSHRNVLLSAFHDAAQACRERNLSPVRDCQSPPLLATWTSSQTLTTSTSIGNTSLPVIQTDSENLHQAMKSQITNLTTICNRHQETQTQAP
jgi:hypothetical protein